MIIKKQHILGILLPALLFLVVVAMDNGVLSMRPTPLLQYRMREGILGIALILFVWGVSRLTWFNELGLTQKIRFLGLAVFLLWGGMQLLHFRMPLFSTNGTDAVFTPTPSFEYSFRTAVVLGVVIMSVLAFTTLKELIFVQQGKKTQSNFRLLRLFIFLHLFVAFIVVSERPMELDRAGGFHDGSTADIIFLSLIGLFSFINGFRCKWIHYLNKSQKAGFLFYFGLICVFVDSLFVQSSDVVQKFSTILGTFTYDFVFFSLIYSGMAFLGILLQLPSAGLMDKRIREIQSLQALSATIGSVFEMDELISKTTELAVEVVGADTSWIELKEGSNYRLVGTRGVRKEDVDEIPGAVRKLLRDEVTRNERALLINDLPRDRRTAQIKKWRRKAGSLLAAQIRSKKKHWGILYALKSDKFGFAEESRGLFQAFADQVAVALENVNLVHVTIEQEVYREELRLAHDAQMRLLPQRMPEIKGVELDAFCMTANEIGGDFYDMIRVGENRVDIVIGDVSGKGASAAFYMAELKGVIQALAFHFTSPKKMLLEVNTFLLNHFDKSTFATMIYGMFIPTKKQIRLVRAGHPPSGLIRKDAVTWLETEGLGLGLSSNETLNETLKEKVLQLKKTDTVLFYTDGLVEARNRAGEEYGEERLEETLFNLKGCGATEMLEGIRQNLESYSEGVPRHDDVTLVALRISE